MSSFQVTPASLRALQQSMIGLAVEFEDGATPSGHYGEGSSVDAGGQLTNVGQLNEADEALQPFYDAWENSLAVTGKMMVDLAKELGKAATDYENTENALNQLLLDAINPPPPPPPLPGGLPLLPGVTPPSSGGH
jgi:hypothetical protein